MNDQKRVIENYGRFLEQCQDYQVTHIAQSPTDYNTSQIRIQELERENVELLRLLDRWHNLFGGDLHPSNSIVEDTIKKLGR